MKYEYYIKLWGGFFNEHNVAKHGFDVKGNHFFNTKIARDVFKEKMLKVCSDLKAKEGHLDIILATREAEGYNVRKKQWLNRVVRYKGEEYHHKYFFAFPDFTASEAQYHLEWKWDLGCNDDTLNCLFPDDNINYDKDVEIIEEWIEGCFTEK